MIGERARTWGSTEAERRLELPCDRHMTGHDEVLHRAVSVSAPPPVVFRWLCQLRVAPYSYDLLDNRGRQSPSELTPGLDELEVGQTVMTIFELVEFEPDRHLTLVLRRASRAFGAIAGTYAVQTEGGGGGPDGGAGERGAATGKGETSRLLVRLLWRYPGRGPVSAVSRRLLPLGDMVMMRRQLLNLKALAERDAAGAG